MESMICSSCEKFKRSVATSPDGRCDQCAGRGDWSKIAPTAPGINQPLDKKKETLPHTPGSETSRKAGESMVAAAKNQRSEIWHYLRDHGGEGLSCQDLERILRMSHGSCSTRIWELREMGRIKRTGRTKPTPAGRQADIYVSVHPDDWTDKRPGWPTMETLSRPQKLKEKIERLRGENARLKAFIADRIHDATREEMLMEIGGPDD